MTDSNIIFYFSLIWLIAPMISVFIMIEIKLYGILIGFLIIIMFAIWKKININSNLIKWLAICYFIGLAISIFIILYFNFK